MKVEVVSKNDPCLLTSSYRLGYVIKLILNVFVLQIDTCLSKVVRKFSS